jgi:hypothetical protein
VVNINWVQIVQVVQIIQIAGLTKNACAFFVNGLNVLNGLHCLNGLSRASLQSFLQRVADNIQGENVNIRARPG